MHNLIAYAGQKKKNNQKIDYYYNLYHEYIHFSCVFLVEGFKL